MDNKRVFEWFAKPLQCRTTSELKTPVKLGPTEDKLDPLSTHTF